MIHSKTYYHILDPEEYSAELHGSNEHKIDPGKIKDALDKNNHLNATAKECVTYLQSIESLFEKLLYLVDEDRVEENELIERNLTQDS